MTTTTLTRHTFVVADATGDGLGTVVRVERNGPPRWYARGHDGSNLSDQDGRTVFVHQSDAIETVCDHAESRTPVEYPVVLALPERGQR